LAKRNNEHLSISDALKEFVETNKLEKGLDKVNVADAWAKLMGNGVNNYTTSVNLERETLYIQLNSSVLREELSYGKQKIIDMLNEELGKEIIKKLILR
jgi:ribosome-associated translation inhibitor RaiA